LDVVWNSFTWISIYGIISREEAVEAASENLWGISGQEIKDV
jgi:hypothetical protein